MPYQAGRRAGGCHSCGEEDEVCKTTTEICGFSECTVSDQIEIADHLCPLMDN